MQYLLTIAVSLVVCMVLVPALIRVAPRLHMMDEPDSRKVHARPVARVGGIGIVVGVLVPLVILFPLDGQLQAYLMGGLLLVAIGAWDDVSELGHYTKLVVQVAAAAIVVYHGDLYVQRLPFAGPNVMSPIVGVPFTIICMVGVINALNHSDGLDGLAGGESLLSLLAIAVLAYFAGDQEVVILAMAMMGGVVGFLRFNTHPARVFMGDAGSQFLGFTLGFLVLRLTQQSNPALSMALPALLIGLPVVDIMLVLAQRVYHGMNWFRATKNHLHHRLLALGFRHHESVILIYTVHAALVVSAVPFRYESDWLVLVIYLFVPGVAFGSVWLAELRGWRFRHSDDLRILRRAVNLARERHLVGRVSFLVVEAMVPVYLVGGAALVSDVPRDFGFIAAGLLVLILVESATAYNRSVLLRRGSMYVIVFFVSYLIASESLAVLPYGERLEVAYLGVAAAAVAVALRYGTDLAFSLTPMDYLVGVVVLGIIVTPSGTFPSIVQDAPGLAIRVLIMVYATELLMNPKRGRRRWNPAVVGAMGAAGVLAFRGLL